MGWELLLTALLPLAFASGWAMARRRERFEGAQTSVNSDYLRGLNYLVNEEADKAVEIFMRLLEVDNETAEVHLALGNLFRRQGEVDRALRLHQNLVARPNLKPQHRNQACYELAKDYLRAGMMDRAENLFAGLVEQGIFLERSLVGLQGIHEQGREWQQAMEVVRRLETVRGQSMRREIAQYLCELAEAERRRRNHSRAQEYLRQALSENPGCVRASLAQGHLYEQGGEYPAAIDAYRQVVRQDAHFVDEVLEPLERCYTAMGDSAGLQQLLDSLIVNTSAISARIAIARHLVRSGQRQQAIAYLNAALREHPNWRGFAYLLSLLEQGEDGQPGDSSLAPLEGLRATLQKLLDITARYRCGHCGFDGRNLHWQCPRCKQWSSMKPLTDLALSVPEPFAAIPSVGTGRH